MQYWSNDDQFLSTGFPCKRGWWPLMSCSPCAGVHLCRRHYPIGSDPLGEGRLNEEREFQHMVLLIDNVSLTAHVSTKSWLPRQHGHEVVGSAPHGRVIPLSRT